MREGGERQREDGSEGVKYQDGTTADIFPANRNRSRTCAIGPKKVHPKLIFESIPSLASTLAMLHLSR